MKYAIYEKGHTSIKYYETSHQVFDYTYEYTPSNKFNLREDVAEDYYYNHDGWEDKWPLKFILWDNDEILIFSADIEATPSFIIREVPKRIDNEQSY